MKPSVADASRAGAKCAGSALSIFFLLPAVACAQGMPWATFLGGSNGDTAFAVAVDDNGMVTVGGFTRSPDWPYGPRPAAGTGAFVMRLDPNASGDAQLVWCTTFDGNGEDVCFDVTVSRDGLIVGVVGLTASSSGLPITPNAWQPGLRGGHDGFVAQLDGATGAITYCSYLGGDDGDYAKRVAVDAGGRLVIAGVTQSLTFWTSAGAYDRTFNGDHDLFVAVLDPGLPAATQLLAATFLGGADLEGLPYEPKRLADMASGGGLAVAEDGSIVVVERTRSVDFPTTAGAYATGFAGGSFGDIFVTRLDAVLGALDYSTYLGGTGDDWGGRIAVRGNRDVFLPGFTHSSDFPVTPGAVQPGRAGVQDGAVVWLHTAGSGPADLRYATFLGGSGPTALTGLQALVLEDTGIVTVVGFTQSLSGTPGAWQSVSSPTEALVARIDPQASGAAGLHYASFLSNAPGNDNCFAVALHGDGFLTLAGRTTTAAFPTTPGALQAAPGGGVDAFVARFDPLPTGSRRVGASTPSCRGPVWLQVNSNPMPGNGAFEVLGNGAPPGATGALALGGPALPGGVPILNATLFVMSPFHVLPAVADPLGAFGLALPLPPSLPPGPSLHAQWFWLTAPGCSSGGPLAASHALGF